MSSRYNDFFWKIKNDTDNQTIKPRKKSLHHLHKKNSEMKHTQAHTVKARQGKPPLVLSFKMKDEVGQRCGEVTGAGEKRRTKVLVEEKEKEKEEVKEEEEKEEDRFFFAIRLFSNLGSVFWSSVRGSPLLLIPNVPLSNTSPYTFHSARYRPMTFCPNSLSVPSWCPLKILLCTVVCSAAVP